MMNKIKILLLLAVFGISYTVAAPTSTPQTSAAPQELDKIVVIANDSVITESEVSQAIAMAKKQLASSNTPLPPAAQLRKQVINSLIDHELQLQLIASSGIKVSNSELNAAIAAVAQQNHMTLQQLKTNVESSGMDYTKYRQQFREQMTISQLQRQAVAGRIKVTDQEVNEFMHKYKNMRNPNAEYHLEDILIPTPDNPSPKQVQKAKQKAESLMQQINQGKSFRELAAAHSGSSQALQGGDFGWRHLAEMPTIFADNVKDMKIGQIAGPLQAPNGFHVVKLVGIRNSTQKLIKDQVRSLIFKRKFEEQLQIWLRQTRETAYVKFE